MSKAIEGVRILLVPVGKEPREAYIEDNFRAFQRAIGKRSFTQVPVGLGVAIIVADDYHGLEDKPNGCGLYGAYFFHATSGNFTDAMIEKCRKYWEARRHETPPSNEDLDEPLMVLSGPALELHRAKIVQEHQAKMDYWRTL